MNKIIFITGGGTGGHLFPAISISEELKKKGFSIIFIGSKFGIEKKYFKKLNLSNYLLNVKGIQRTLSLKSIIINFGFPFKFIFSYIQSLIIIRRHKPLAIIGTGGYASGLPLLAGLHSNIPIMIQEQNSIPGIITKYLHKNAAKIFLGSEYAMKILKNSNAIYTGNPLRGNLEILNKKKCKDKLLFDNQKKLILIVGGSQGAEAINNYILNSMTFFLENNCQVLWQTGNYSYKKIKNKINNKNIKYLKFINNISEAYSAADIIISRAGAIAISEIAYFKKATIFIPLPTSSDNHQQINAECLEEKEACVIINQEDLNKHKLEDTINYLLSNNNAIKKLENNINKFAKPMASKDIANKIINLIK
jgi:UDP-N-acetylglucosamine--N-acetylmuramyl-(pentapeptide) pyrophosphoryl-undecaprenol N-acetylglucosamine transferase